MSTNTLKQALEIVYGDIKNINKRVKNLESASAGVLYNETTKSAVAYQDNVSANACPYALLNKVGGMSYKSENLLVLSDRSQTREGVTFTTSANSGSVTLNNTSTNNQYSCFTALYQNQNGFPNGLKAGDYISLKLFGTITNVTMLVYYYTTSWEILVNSQITASNVQIPSNAVGLMIRVGCLSSGITFNNQVVYPMLVSGSTAPTEFKVGFEGIRDSAVTSVVSKDSNDNILATGDIPNEIQALEGYGQSNPDDSTEYNYIDFVNKTFVRVGYIDNGAWVSSALTTDISQYIDDNSIQIEANGTITFNNTYEQAIPYEYLYLEKVGANNE